MTLSLPESAKADQWSTLLDVANDHDSPRNGIDRYQIVPAYSSFTQPFDLVYNRSLTGQHDLRLVLRHAIDREQQPFYQVKVLAIDGGDEQNTGSVVIDISVIDVNDNIPIFVSSSVHVEITENAPPDQHLTALRAIDNDSGINGHVIYSFSEITRKLYGDIFEINEDSGVVTQLMPIDFEHLCHLSYYEQNLQAGK